MGPDGYLGMKTSHAKFVVGWNGAEWLGELDTS